MLRGELHLMGIHFLLNFHHTKKRNYNSIYHLFHHYAITIPSSIKVYTILYIYIYIYYFLYIYTYVYTHHYRSIIQSPAQKILVVAEIPGSRTWSLCCTRKFRAKPSTTWTQTLLSSPSKMRAFLPGQNGD